MKHARDDYSRIQDPAGLIPEDEPVFLIRAKDPVSGDAVRAWADLHDANGGPADISALARMQADAMDRWAPKQAHADLPAQGDSPEGEAHRDEWEDCTVRGVVAGRPLIDPSDRAELGEGE